MRKPKRKIIWRKLSELKKIRSNKLTLRSRIATLIILVSLKQRHQVFSDSKQARAMMKRMQDVVTVEASEVVAEDAVTVVDLEAALVEVISVEAEEIDAVVMALIVKTDVVAMAVIVKIDGVAMAVILKIDMPVRIALSRAVLARKAASSVMLINSLHCEDLIDTQSIMDDWNRVKHIIKQVT